MVASLLLPRLGIISVHRPVASRRPGWQTAGQMNECSPGCAQFADLLGTQPQTRRQRTASRGSWIQALMVASRGKLEASLLSECLWPLSEYATISRGNQPQPMPQPPLVSTGSSPILQPNDRRHSRRGQPSGSSHRNGRRKTGQVHPIDRPLSNSHIHSLVIH